jgi:hypothetical protein
MDGRSEKTVGAVLILLGISMWSILPPRGVPFTNVLLIHMSMVLPGIYLFERSFIRYIWYKLRGGK